MTALTDVPKKSDVKTALGESTDSLISLCTSENINVWSKWKPVKSDLVPMTYAALKAMKYGITILQSNTAAGLLTLVQNANGVGYTYTRPTGGSSSPYRLRDFRYYNKDAGVPIYPHYQDGDTEKIANVSSTYSIRLDGIESIDVGENEDDSQTAGISRASIYPSGSSLNRGCLLKYNTTTVWSVGTVPYGLSNWQALKGKTCTCLEFLTNLSSGTRFDDPNYTPNTNDRFYALPYGICSITLLNQTPAGSKMAFCEGRVDLSSDRGTVTYRVRFSSMGEVYAGGTLSNVYLGLYKERTCRTAIATRSLGTVTLGAEATSSYYSGSFTNNTYSENVFFAALWGGDVGWVTQPMAMVDPTA